MTFLWRVCWTWAIAVAASGSAALCDPAPSPTIAAQDLQRPFDARSPWTLVIRQGPPTEDYGGNPAPGALDICLQKSPADPCMRSPVSAPPSDPAAQTDWGPHYLGGAKPVYPDGRAGPPLLQLVTSSLHAGDGGQVVVTQFLRYDRARDAFDRVYFRSTGTNNNQEVRFVADGPLKGDLIAAEPTGDAPYGYWITVDKFTPAHTYRQAIRYRSATRYNDGNPLPVIDSETPNIERRLGLWKPGSPLPTPAGAPCPTPSLKHMELWCQ